MNPSYGKIRNLQELSDSFIKLAVAEKLPERADEALTNARTCLDKAKTLVDSEDDEDKILSKAQSQYKSGNAQSTNTKGEGSIKGQFVDQQFETGEGSDARAASS